VFEAFRDDTKRQCLHVDVGDRFIAVSGVAHDTRQRRHFGQPAAIVFSLKFDRKHHAHTVRPCPLKRQPDARMMALRLGIVRRRIARINAPLALLGAARR